jgi:hypothetical protein
MSTAAVEAIWPKGVKTSDVVRRLAAAVEAAPKLQRPALAAAELILVYLARWQPANGGPVDETVEQVADATGLSERIVVSAFDILEAAGLVEIGRRGTIQRRGQPGRGTERFLTLTPRAAPESACGQPDSDAAGGVSLADSHAADGGLSRRGRSTLTPPASPSAFTSANTSASEPSSTDGSGSAATNGRRKKKPRHPYPCTCAECVADIESMTEKGTSS